jgi:serine/threonine protein phosphatase PrpC
MNSEPFEFDPTQHRIAFSASIASELHTERNEDNFVVDRQHDVYGVFDGVGGYAGGELASQTAANVIHHHAADISSSESLDDTAAQLKEALFNANGNIMRVTREAATTAVIAKIHEVDGALYASIAHVGDSRAYILHDGVLRGLTTDHTPSRVTGHTVDAMARQERLAEVIDINVLSQNSMMAFRHRNIIGACLGRDYEVKSDVKHFIVESGDILILTSDGVHDNLTTQEMQALLLAVPNADYAQLLTEAAHERAREAHIRAKMDDITAVAVKI